MDSSNTSTPLTIALIGTTSLLIKCASTLFERGHRITCICSDDNKVIEWALAHHICHTRTVNKFYQVLSPSPPQYILSIVNPIILRQPILSIPSIGAINYHDSLLPRYAGSHATMWAIAKGETLHGITWHKIAAKVDAGKILLQKKITIESNDTVSSLNLKCFRAAVESFAELLSLLEKKDIQTLNVPLKSLQFFYSYTRPTLACIVDFNQPAEKIKQLFSALDYRHVDNIVGVPRILLPNGTIITGKSASIVSTESNNTPGLIEKFSPDSVQVSTKSNRIQINDCHTLLGEKLTQAQVLNVVEKNNVMPSLGDMNVAQLSILHRACVKYEKFWVKRIQKSHPHRLSFLNNPISKETYELLAQFKPENDHYKDIINSCYHHNTIGDITILEMIIIVFLLRINDYYPFTVAVQRDIQDASQHIQSIFSSYLPININFYSGLSFIKLCPYYLWIKNYLKKRQTYYNDVFIRYTALKGKFPFSTVGIIHGDSLPTDASSEKFKIIFLITSSHNIHIYANVGALADERYIKRMPMYLSELVKNLSFQLTKPIRSLNIVPKSEREWQQHKIFKRTVLDDECLCSKVINQIRRLRLKHALRVDDELFTYQQLYRRIRQIAGYLNYTFAPDQYQTVAILLPLSLDLVASMLAASCALGKTFVLINPKHPATYNKRIITTANADIVISNPQYINEYKFLDRNKIMDIKAVDKKGKIAHYPKVTHKRCVDPYIVFTSGSTGNPKGVRITTLGFKNIVLEYTRRYYFSGKQNRVACLTQYTFDAFILEVFACLFSGGILHLVSNRIRYDPILLSNYLSLYSIDMLVLTPSLLRLIQTVASFPKLKTIIACGEKCEQWLVNHWAKNRIFINAYGPAENTICTSMYRCKVEDKTPFIGKPMPNIITYVLDKYQQLLPIGNAGELYIGGVGLASEYVNNPEETKRLFPYLMIDNTFQRYYKTGDFVKLHLNGQLEFLYRQDHQFKIRGYRIELGEIEKVIASHQSVAASRVMVSQSKDNSQETSLIALIVKENAQENDEHTNVSLNEYIAKQLPHYMRPGRYVFLKKLPLSLHDKVNQLQLEQIVKRLPNREKQSLTHLSTKERLILSIFNSLFKKDIDNATADFFALGGDSMTAMSLISILKSQGYTLSLNDVFKFSTIQALAKRLTRHRLTESNTTHLQQRNHILLSPIQRWFFKQGFTYPNQWSQACFITLKKYQTLNTLTKIVNQLFHKHDVFKLCFDIIGYANLSIETQTITMLFHQTDDFEKNWRKKITHTLYKANHLINIRQGPLLIGVAAGTSKNKITNLVLICHHLVIDAVSWNIIIGNLNCYIKRSQTPAKVFHEHTFIHWMLHSNTFPIGCYCSVRYESSNYNIPMDFDKGDRRYAQISDIKLLLTEKETAELLYLSHYIFKVKVHTLLLYILSQSIHEIYRLSRITIDLELHGRDMINVSMPLDEAIGWFTSIIPVNITTDEKLTDEDRIAMLATNIRNTKSQYPYVDLTAHSNITLNYWGNWDFGFERKNDIFVLDHIEILSAKQNKAPYPLSIEAYIKQKRLHLIFSYSRHHFAKETIRILSKRWRANLVQLIKKYTPSKASFSQPLRYLSDKQYFQLSSLQKGLFYIASMLQKHDPYAVQVSIELSGLIDVNHIKHALKRLMYTYPFLCVSIDHRQTEPTFTIAPSVRLPFKLINLSHLSDEQARQQFKKQQNADRCQSISLKGSPLVRFILIKFSEKRASLIFTAHHIIMDGWSLKFLMKTFLSLYDNKNTILIPEANDLKIHQHYLQWLVKQKQNTQVIEFWKRYLNDFSTPTLSNLIAKEKTKEMKQVNINRWIDKARMNKITDFIQSYKITLSTFLHAIFSIVLYRYTQANDVLFGTTVTHRQAPIQGIRESVGFYFNTVPFRYQFNGSDTFSTVLNAIKTSYLQIIEHGVLDLHMLRSYTQLSEGSELFDAMFIFEQHTKISDINNAASQNELKIKSYAIDNPTHYPLSLTVLALDQIQLTLTQDIMKLNTIEGETFLDSFIHTIDACINDADNKLTQYSLLSKEKIVQQCVQWNDTTVRLKDTTIIDLIDQVALANPDKVAIQYQEESITYRELIKKSNNLAHYLLEQSINKQAPIALYMERNIHLIVFIFGILKSGHAFVPFDSDAPILRVLDSLKHSQIAHLYISKKYYDKYQPALREQRFVTVHSLPFDISSITHRQSLPKVGWKQLAYVLFTSGSTGHPKGVCIKHMSLLNVLQGMQTILSITKNDRLLAFTPITFDISLLEIFLPLISGATCILTKTIKQQGIFSLLSVIKNTPITLMQTTPSTWSFLIEAGWLGNRTVTLICGGDTLLVPLATNLLKRCKRLFHVYGPTETTIWSTCTQITQATLQKQGIEIGKPIQNNYVFVLDQHGNLLPVGCKGKLYIGGCSVAAGYCDKKLTATAFKPIQISREMVQIKQEHASKLYYLDKLYYTGDIVQWNKSTNLTFTGRADSQVKVRGFRVDLTEIEHVLLKTLSIKQAIVLFQTFPDQDKKLVAYYVADKPVAMSVLKKQISSHLPYYMLPSNFIQIDKLPLTKHGKIDKQKLLAHQGAAKPVDRQLKQTYFTYFQQKVARIWKDVLSRTLIQPADDFFSCGGHSLLVLTLVNVIDKILGIKIPLDLIIQYPHFIDFCDALEKHKSEKSLFMTQRIINFHDKKIPDPLIKLVEGHSNRPLFLFHPIGGTVFWYIKFASKLKKLGIFPIYAFQDPGILSQKTIFNRFDEMAECYSKIITTIQPCGPYYLAGASSGANMAVTAANMLYDQHQSIAFVGLFDGWAKYPRQLLQPNIFHAIMESQYSTLKEKFKRMGMDSMDALFRIQMQRQQLLFDHKQTPIPFKINLYKSTTIAPIFKTINEKSNYWEHYCKNELIIHNVPGDHETMFSNENARALAKIVFDDMPK